MVAGAAGEMSPQTLLLLLVGLGAAVRLGLNASTLLLILDQRNLTQWVLAAPQEPPELVRPAA